MRSIVKTLDRWLYAKYQNNWDNHRFREEILARMSADATVLDLGAGAGIVAETRFRGCCQRVCGVDPDERILKNPYLDDAQVGIGEALPYSDSTFDLTFANNVLEHLDDPTAVFREVARVLKPGGLFLTKTPNRWHYVPLIAACTPHWFHQQVNRWRGRNVEDTFPTRYRANCARDLRQHAQAAGLVVQSMQFVEGRPEYLRITPPTYLVGWAYERCVNTLPGLSGFRCVMISVLRKPTSAFASPVKRAA